MGGKGPEAGRGPAKRPIEGNLIAPGGKVDREALAAAWAQQPPDDDSPVSVRIRVGLSAGLDKRLDRYLVDRVPFLSRTTLQRLIREEAVTVNGQVAKASMRVRGGDEIVAILPPPPSSQIPAEEIPLRVLYEDEHLIVIDKQDDIIVHPARGNQSGTIINGLVWHFTRGGGRLSQVGEELARPGVVHRLDRHTTGLLVFAKTEIAHWRLARQFERRQTQKRYLAIVQGEVEPLADLIDLPLGKHPTVREKYAVRFDETGKPSQTVYHVRELYRGFTLLELELRTGRTHQIRVHLSYLGYPVAGDDMYGVRTGWAGGPERDGAATGQDSTAPLIGRQALHAAVLSFVHPVTREPMSFRSPLPPDMRNLVLTLRGCRFRSAPALAGAAIDLGAMVDPRT